MASTLTARAVSTEDKLLDRLQPQMVKATLRSQALSIEMSGIVRDALIREFGSLKAAAITMDIDQGQLTRELDAGKLNLARLEKCGAAFMLKFGLLMVEHAQPLTSPVAQGFKDLSEMERRIQSLRQLLEHCA